MLALIGALQAVTLLPVQGLAQEAAATTSGADAVAAPSAPAPGEVPTQVEPGRLMPCPTSMGSLSSSTLAPVSPGTVALIRDRLKKKVGAPTSICRTPFGLYEVIVDGDFFYVDERANFLLSGNVFDLRNSENLTEARKEDAFRVDFKSLPLQLAVKTVRGDGTRVLAIFEDPNCPYCKRFEKEIATLSNATIYTFLYPILSRDVKAPDDSYPKSKAIWCAPDRGAAWAQVMLAGKHLEAAPDTCKHPLEEILALGQKLHISGTPTLLFTDGRRAPGAIPLERVEKMMAEASRPAKTAQ
jgi:thiol:disulfide interchange protein DsbC